MRLFRLVFLFALIGPAQLFAMDEAQWREALSRVRSLEDKQAAAAEVTRLASEAPATLTENQQFEWLSLKAAVLRAAAKNAEFEQAVIALEDLAQRSNLKAIKAEALILRAQLFKDAGNTTEGLERVREALALVDALDDLRVRYLVHSSAAIHYSDTSDFENALQQHLAALDLAEQSDEKRDARLLQTLNNIGAMYLHLRVPEKALQYLQRAEPLAESQNDKAMLSTALTNMGYALASLGRNDDATAAYKKALRLSREMGDENSESVALVNLSDDALQRERWSEAADYARQALVLSQKYKNRNNEAVARANIGLSLAGQKLYQQALRELRNSQQILQSVSDLATEDLVLAEIANVSELASEFPEAVAALRRQLEIREQLYSESRQRAVSELQERFDATARAKQIDLLERENKIQAVEIENRRLYLWVAGLVGVTVILAAVVVLLSYRRVRDANKQLQAANEQLADQSVRDPLTGLFNRRSFQLAMEKRWTERDRRAVSDDRVDAFVLLDIDHFKRINDGFGHAAGDAVLVEVARRLSAGMRDRDMVLRWGGEEFLLYLRATTSEALQDVVARVLHTLGSTPVEFEGKRITVTASAGFVPLPFSRMPESEFGWERAVQLADLALYLGKGRGRNRAYGVLQVNGNYQEIAPQMEQNLAHAIRHHQVTAVEVLGPGATQADLDD